MTDRELLEQAAKAAGYSVEWVERRIARIGAFKQLQHERRDGFVMAGKEWNPLTDDGDALRLAVKLHMEIDHNHPADQQPWVSVRAAPSHMYSVDEFEDESGRMAATRRAITRAAAEIGKAQSKK